MPQLDNNSLDDQLLLDGSLSFTAGQFSYSRANAVPDGGYFQAKNMDFDSFGGVTTRRGTAQLLGNVVTGDWEDITTNWEGMGSQVWSGTFTSPVRDIFFFDAPSGEYMAVADGDNQIKFVTEASVAQTIGGSSYSGENVYFAQLTNRLYFCDGSANLKYITSGQVLTDIGSGRITSVDVTGPGRGYTTAPSVSVSGGSTPAAFTSSLGPDGVVASITVTAGGSGYDRSATVTVAATGVVQATAIARISQTPLAPKLLAAHAARLFCASADSSVPSDTVYVSDILDGESWDLISNSVRVGGGDGDPVTAIYPWYGFKLLVFKERSIWYIEANPAQNVSDWEVKLISSRTGCVAHKTVQQVGSDVYFLSREGVQSLSTIESGAQTGVSLPISAPVHDVIERINKQYYSRSSATYYRNRYILSFPTESSAISTTLVYNTLLRAWSGTWDGWKPRAFAVTAFGGKIRMSFGDESGKLFTWLDYAEPSDANESYFFDQGTPYDSYIVTKSYSFGERYADKFGYQAQFGLDNTFFAEQLVNFNFVVNLSTPTSCSLQEDGAGAILTEDGNCVAAQFIEQLGADVAVPPLTGLFRKSFNIQSNGRFTELQFVVSADSGRLSLQSVKASAFADTIRPEL